MSSINDSSGTTRSDRYREVDYGNNVVFIQLYAFLDKLRDDLANQKLLNNELLRRLQHVEQEKTELEDKIACSNLRFIEIATLRLKLNEEERLHHSCRQKVSQLENDRSYLQKEVQQLTKVNQNLHQFVYSPAYSKQMQGLKNESKKKERKLLGTFACHISLC